MQDVYGRLIDYLRISITDRCNFRCSYCMPPEGIKLIEHSEILSYEELLRIISIVGQHGINKIRLTGGEPLVRKGLVEFIRSIKKNTTIKDLGMTTNGSLLADQAYELKVAGLDRVNISLDTNNPDGFSRITGRGQLADVVNGIQSALEADLSPVKLNVVVTELLSEEDILYFIEQVHKYPIAVRFIEYMPIGRCGVRPGYSIATIKNMISTAGQGELAVATIRTGNGPATYYRLPRARGMFGFITPISEHFCQNCNRIRLTADGKIKPCLLANHEIDIKAVLRSGGSDEELYKVFLKAVQDKPMGHHLAEPSGGADLTRGMFQVGG